MAKQAVAQAEEIRIVSPMHRFWVNFKRCWQLHLMILLPLAYIIIFEYFPMYGLQVAFRDFRAKAGIWGSEWIGLKSFIRFFNNYKWKMFVQNTITISMYQIIAGFPIPIILALFLHVNEHPVLKKITQTVSYVPHFISTVVMVAIINQIFNPFGGLYGTIMNMLGVVKVPDIRANADTFYHLFVWTGIWQGMGWSAIMYVSALSAVPMELHEAAKIDGATRLRRVFAVDLPAIMPTVTIMLILRFGSIMSVGYQKVYLMQNDLNITKSEVISTHVYKAGLANNDMSYGSAVGLMNNVINTSMVLLVNWVTDRLSDGEGGLF